MTKKNSNNCNPPPQMIEHSDDDDSSVLTEAPSPPTTLESGGKGMPAGPILEALGRCTPAELVLDDDDDYQLDDIENSRNERSPTFVNRISSIPQCGGGALPPMPSERRTPPRLPPKQKSSNEEEVLPTIPPPPSIRKLSPRAASKHMVTEQFKLHYQKLPRSEQIKLLKEVKLVLGDESMLTGLYDGQDLEEEEETAKHYKGKDDEDESLLQSSVDNSTSRRSKGSQYDETTTAFGTQFTGAGEETTAFGTIDDDQTNTAFYTLDTAGEDTNTAFGTLYTNYTMDTRNTLDTKDTMDDTFMSGSVLSDVYSDDDDDEPFFNLTDACVTYLCDGKYSEGPNKDEQKAKEAARKEQRSSRDKEKERVNWDRHKRYKERLKSFNKSDSDNSDSTKKKEKKRSDDDKSNIDDSMLGSWAVGPANKYDNPHTALGHYNKANKSTPLTVKERLEMKQGLMKPKPEPVLEEVVEEEVAEEVIEEPKQQAEQSTSAQTLEEKLQGVKEATEKVTYFEPSSEKPFWKENTSVYNVDDETTAIQSSVFWKGDGVFDADEGTTEIGAIECEANVDDSEVALNGSGTSSNTGAEQSTLLQCGRSTPLEMPHEDTPTPTSSLDKPNLLTKARSFGRSKSFTRVISTLSQKISRLDESQQQDGTARPDAESLTFESEVSLDNATKGSNSTNKTTSNSSSDSNNSSLSPKKKGWKQYTCQTSGRAYYSNGTLTTWDRPLGSEIVISRPSTSTASRICPRSGTPISVGGESSGLESASTPIASNVLEKVELSLPPKQHKKKKSFNLGFFKSKKNTTDKVPACISKTVPSSPDRTVTSTSTSSSKQELATITTDATGVDSISVSSSKKKKKREWKEYIDQNTGKKYYSNGISTSWDKPDGFVVASGGGESTYTEACSDAAITSSASIARKLTRWREYTDVSSGKKYYSNGISTTWDRDNFFNEHAEGVC